MLAGNESTSAFDRLNPTYIPWVLEGVWSFEIPGLLLGWEKKISDILSMLIDLSAC